MTTTRVFEKVLGAYKQRPRYISSCGGTRSGKTFSILQLLYFVHLGEERRNNPPKVTSIVSESFPHLKRGAIRDFQTILITAGLWDENKWSKGEHTYRFDNGGIIEFFSIDDAGKVFGAARDRVFINECQHINYETARQLFVRTRDVILLDYNPTHSFWCMEQIEGRENCITLHSTYKDNTFLTKEQVTEIESNKGDANWWRVFGEGRVGTLEGLIYDFDTISKMPDKDGLVEVWGMDFGFTNDPTAIVMGYADTGRKILYVQEKCYKTGMLNSDIVGVLRQTGLDDTTEIFADCAEPKSIAEIYNGGFNVQPCDKSQKGLTEQLQWMRGWKLYVTKDSLNLIHELRNYAWAQDKTGKKLNMPIDKFNHAADAMRYMCWTKFGKNAGAGQYNISFGR